jgi:hypothetical protein
MERGKGWIPAFAGMTVARRADDVVVGLGALSRGSDAAFTAPPR